MWFARAQYILERLVRGLPIILAIVVVNFFLIRLAPGDAAQVLAGEAGAASPEYMEQIRRQFGLDQPLYVQFLSYMKNIVTFDLGYSFRHGREVSSLIAERLGATALLMVAAMTISVGLGTLLAVIRVAGGRGVEAAVAAYVEELGRRHAAPTVKQRLAAIRMMFDWLATGGILPFNPASAVRGPKHVVKRGKTPVLAPDEARQLLDAIDVSTPIGLRDRALIGPNVGLDLAEEIDPASDVAALDVE